MKSILALLFIFLIFFTSCLKDKYQTENISSEIEWNPSFATPLAYGNLQLVDIVKEQENGNYSIEYFTEDNPNDTLIRVVVSQDSIFSYTPFDFLKHPIIDRIDRHEEIGNVAIDDYQGDADITLRTIIKDQYPSSQADFNNYDGTLSNIPEIISEQSSFDYEFMGYTKIEWVQFSSGEIAMTTINNLDIPIKFELVLYCYDLNNSKYEFGRYDFTTDNSGVESFIAPGASRTKILDVTGRRGSTIITYNMQNTVIGASNNVIIDLDDRLIFSAVSSNLEASSGRAIIPLQDFALDTTTYFNVDSYEGKQIKGIEVKKGTFYYRLESTLDAEIDIEVSFPSISKGFDTLHTRAQLYDRSVDGVWPLQGYTIDLTTNPAKPYNSLPAKLTYKVSSNGEMRNFNANDYVDAQFANNDSIEFKMAYGFFGYDTIVIEEDTMASQFDDFLKDYYEGEIYLAEPSVSLILDNSVGITGELDVSITGENKSGETVDLLNGVRTWNVLGPAIDKGAVNYRNELILDNTTSNINEFISLLPTTITYSGILYSNKGKSSDALNFVSDNSNATLSMHAEFPLKLSMKNVVLRTDVPFSLANEYDLQSIEFLKLYFNVRNQFPLDLSLELILLDTLASQQELDTLTIDFVKSAESDDNGQVPRGSYTEHTEIFKLVNEGENSQLDNFLHANKMRVDAKFNTENMGDKIVTLFTYYDIDFKFGIKTKVLVDTEF